MVPGSFGCGRSVLDAMAMFAPSRAARNAMARPIPREAPVMKRVLLESIVGLRATSYGLERYADCDCNCNTGSRASPRLAAAVAQLLVSFYRHPCSSRYQHRYDNDKHFAHQCA